MLMGQIKEFVLEPFLNGLNLTTQELHPRKIANVKLVVTHTGFENTTQRFVVNAMI